MSDTYRKLLEIEQQLNRNFEFKTGYLGVENGKRLGNQIIGIQYSDLQNEKELKLWCSVAKKFAHLSIHPWNYDKELWSNL